MTKSGVTSRNGRGSAPPGLPASRDASGCPTLCGRASGELIPGVIAAIQTFGDRINLHPHLHFLVTEGGVDKAGVFHKIFRIGDSRLAE
jgi:hypothetical protein